MRVLLLIGGLLALVYVSRSRWVDRRLTAATAALIERFTTIPAHEGVLAELPHGRAVVEVSVRDGDVWAHRRVDETIADDQTLLSVERRGRERHDRPDGDLVLAPGDTLVVYGMADDLFGAGRRVPVEA